MPAAAAHGAPELKAQGKERSHGREGESRRGCKRPSPARRPPRGRLQVGVIIVH